MEKIKIALPGQVLFLEEVAAEPGRGEKIAALLKAWCLPVWLLERAGGRGRSATLDDLATVIFSSG